MLTYSKQQLTSIQLSTNQQPPSRRVRRRCWYLRIKRQANNAIPPAHNNSRKRNNSSSPNIDPIQHSADNTTNIDSVQQLSINTTNHYTVIPSPTDGHCFLHSISTCLGAQGINLSTAELILLIQEDFFVHLQTYSIFCPDIDLVNQLKLYTTERIYNTDFGDLVPLITANAIKCNIKIYSLNLHCSLDVTGRVTQGRQCCVRLHNEHYDAVVHLDSPLSTIAPISASKQQKNYPIRDTDKPRINNSNAISIPTKTSAESSKKQTKGKRPIPALLLANAQSLTNKIGELDATIRENNIQVAIITETWCKERNINTQQIQGFTQHAAYRKEKNGGGVSIYVDKNYDQTLLHTSISNDAEIIVVQIKSECNKWRNLLIGTYRPPHAPKDAFIEEILDIIQKYEEIDTYITLAGDFNRADINPIRKTCNLKSTVNFNTRQQAKLDDILTNAHAFYNEPKPLGKIGNSDHITITMTPKKEITKMTIKKVQIYDKREHHIYNLKKEISNTNWEEGMKNQSVDDQVEYMYAVLEKSVTRHIPKRIIKLTNKDPKWVTPLVKDILKQKHRQDRKGNTVKSIFLAKKIETVIKQTKTEVYRDERLKNQRGSAGWWKLINKEKSEQKSMDKLIESYNSPEDAANGINDYFIEICTTKLHEDQHWEPGQDHTPIPTEDLPTEEEVLKLLTNINPRKSGGIYPSWLWKELAQELYKPLHTIFINSLTSNTMPKIWKQDRITPIPKIKTALKCSNLRPITVTDSPAKCLEKIVDRRINSAITKSISNDQFAYRENSSAEIALTILIHEIQQQINTNQSIIRIILADMEKAFDSVEHTFVLQHLDNIQEMKPYVPWIASFLRKRQQQVKIKGITSSWKEKTRGLPQGTITGPRLFSIIPNDLKPKSIRTTYIKYADDLSGIHKIKRGDPDNSQAEMENIEEWAEDKKMKLNVEKTMEIVVNKSKINQHVPLLQTKSGKTIQRTSSAKVLGLQIDENLNFRTHIRNTYNKCNSKLYLLKQLKHKGYNAEDLRYFYLSCLLPTITYGYTAWCSAAERDIQPLKRIHRRAQKIIGNLDIGTLERHLKKKLSSVFQSAAENETHPLNKIIPPNKQNHGRTLRSEPRRNIDKPRTELFKRSFVYRGCTL